MGKTPKLNESILSYLLGKLFMKELDKKLSTIADTADDKVVDARAKEIRKGFEDLEKSLKILCKAEPDHSWCKPGGFPMRKTVRY